MHRRTFIASALAAPIVAGLPMPAMPAPETLLTFRDCNMAGCEWEWAFDLIYAPDGTFTVTALQTDLLGEYDDWELDPISGLRDSSEIREALVRLLDNAGYSEAMLD